MVWLLAIALSQTPQPRRFIQPNMSRVGGASSTAWVQSEQLLFAVAPQMPVCTGDAHCVFQCRIKADLSSGACYDNAGAEMTGYTEGVSAQFAPSYIAGVGAWTGINDTANANRVPRINNAAMRALYAGDHTIVLQGYPTTVVGADQWMFMIPTDGTNSIQIRRSSGNLQCVEIGSGGSAISSTPLSVDGFSVMSCRRSAGDLIARAMEAEGSAVVSSMAAPASGSTFLVGGSGACCTPQGSAAGQWLSFTGYDEAKSETWLIATNKAAFGASAVQSGPGGSAGTVATTPIGNEPTDAGYVFMFVASSYIGSPTIGIHSQLGFTNFVNANPLNVCGGTDVGAPACEANLYSGPFSLWKNTPECDLIIDDDGAAFEGKRSAGITGLDGGFGQWVNASAYLMPGDGGTTINKARILITTDGTVDAGSVTCDVTIGAGRRRYPEGVGCWAWVDNATSITMDVLVGNTAATTGSISACQWQLTSSLFPEAPTINGTARGSTWPELDGGMVPSGGNRGKLEAVFSLRWSTSQFGAFASRSPGAYLYDSYTSGSTHDVLQWLSSVSNEPSADGLIYGPSGTGYPDVANNRFDIHPVPMDAGTFYVASYEWVPSGVLVDGGVGCRGTMRLDACADPSTCHATTILGQNTSAAAECPSQSNIIDIGTRQEGSSPTTFDLYSLAVSR